MEQDLSSPIKDIISRQYTEVKSAHDRLRDLCDAKSYTPYHRQCSGGMRHARIPPFCLQAGSTTLDFVYSPICF
jgi:hypothetical protein